MTLSTIEELQARIKALESANKILEEALENIGHGSGSSDTVLSPQQAIIEARKVQSMAREK